MGIFTKAEELRKKVDLAQEDLNKELMDIALNNSPYKIGEEISITGGYSHVGKKGIIENIGKASFSRWNSYKFICSVSGIVLKKDGTIGKQHFEFDIKFKDSKDV